MLIYNYTNRQLEVQKLIHNLGFGTILEFPVAQYCIDIVIPELDNLVVEIDGPQHYKKERERRELVLKQHGFKYFIYVPVSYTDKEFLTLFDKKLGEFFGKGLIVNSDSSK